MTIARAEVANLYLQLCADCIPVRGASRCAICDLTRHEILLVPSSCYELLAYLSSDRMGVVLQRFVGTPGESFVEQFIECLRENDMIMFVSDPSLFPPIAERWEAPGVVQNAIIDVDDVVHDFERIFSQLDELGCQFVQIRGFSSGLSIERAGEILGLACHTSIEGVELILQHDPNISDDVYLRFLEAHSLLGSLTVHSAPADATLTMASGTGDDPSWPSKWVRFVRQRIDSHRHCGVIAVSTLTPPSVSTFFEGKLFNGCLNGKVSIDAGGHIKNCPSMSNSYGNIATTTLTGAVKMGDFKRMWAISKDQIQTCKDCEFRYVCSDCRAYLENPDDSYSKPLKCGYDPYSGEWTEWSASPLKQQAIRYYGIPHSDATSAIESMNAV
jgi:SPASM domain peptide maturase of grasp-with-spasm system